jgi:hypothetical protein
MLGTRPPARKHGVWLISAIALMSVVAGPRRASADTMDPALARLVTDNNCRVTGENGALTINEMRMGNELFQRCGTDDAAFAKLVAQYGFAFASSAMHSARTTGFGGFELALEADFTQIDSGAGYWRKGTQGAQDPTTKLFKQENASPDGILQHYDLKIKKGFPFGLELTGAFGYMANTSLFSVGADVRLSLLEGFRTGLPAILPEIAAGGSVRTITGTEDLQLTVVGVDGQISKPIPIGGVVVLTPYAGYQLLRIFGDSGLIDLTPNTDALNYCGFKGTNTRATPDPNKQAMDADPTNPDPNKLDGQPVCDDGPKSADFNNSAVFAPVRLWRHRINFGLQLRFQIIKFGAHFALDAVKPEAANKGKDYEIAGENVFKGLPQQWTLAFDLGAVF